MSFRLAHISDCHLGPLPAPRLRDLLSKRALGYVNWKRNREKTFHAGITQRLIDDLHTQAPGHIAVTGDVVNIALEAEFEGAATFLRTLGDPAHVTVIPGNHDAYVRGALKRFNHHCAPFMTSDDAQQDIYPVLRKRGPVQIIGLSSAVATAPFRATGKVDMAQQEAMEAALREPGDAFCLLLIHHPPFAGATGKHHRLLNDEALRERWSKHAPHLILHGHTHLPTRKTIPGPHGPVAVFGVSSAAQGIGGHKPPANYTLFDIEEDKQGWQVTATRRGYMPSDASKITQIAQETFTVQRT